MMEADGLHAEHMCRGISDLMSVPTTAARKQTSSTTVSNSGSHMRHKHMEPGSVLQSDVRMSLQLRIHSKRIVNHNIRATSIRPLRTADNAPSASRPPPASTT